MLSDHREKAIESLQNKFGWHGTISAANFWWPDSAPQ